MINGCITFQATLLRRDPVLRARWLRYITINSAGIGRLPPHFRSTGAASIATWASRRRCRQFEPRRHGRQHLGIRARRMPPATQHLLFRAAWRGNRCRSLPIIRVKRRLRQWEHSQCLPQRRPKPETSDHSSMTRHRSILNDRKVCHMAKAPKPMQASRNSCLPPLWSSCRDCFQRFFFDYFLSFFLGSILFPYCGSLSNNFFVYMIRAFVRIGSLGLATGLLGKRCGLAVYM